MEHDALQARCFLVLNVGDLPTVLIIGAKEVNGPHWRTMSG